MAGFDRKDFDASSFPNRELFYTSFEFMWAAMVFCTASLSEVESNFSVCVYGLTYDLIWGGECGESNFFLNSQPTLLGTSNDYAFASTLMLTANA